MENSGSGEYSILLLAVGSLLGALLIHRGVSLTIEYYLNMPFSGLALLGLGSIVILLILILVSTDIIDTPDANFENSGVQEWFVLMWLTYVGLVIWLQPTGSSHFWVIPIMLAIFVVKNRNIGNWLGNNLDKAKIPTPQGPMEYTFNEETESMTETQTVDEESSVESTEFPFKENYLKRGEIDDKA